MVALDPVPFNWNDPFPSHKYPLVPALTTGAGLIWMVNESDIETGQIPFPTAVKVTVIVPDAPALGIITGLKVVSDPAWIVAGPDTFHEYKVEFWTLAPVTVYVPVWQIVPFVPASTIGFAIISNTMFPVLVGQTPFVDDAVKVRVTNPVWPVAGV